MNSIAPEAQSLAAALRGQYQIDREVGRGGMGIVFLARDLKLDRAVAIKTLPAHLGGDSVLRERFLREARTAAALSHPCIVPIHRADEIDGNVFFVMGFVDGAPLSQFVRETGPIPPRTAVAILHDVAEALAYAHQSGVVHRDVKAENILVERATGRALVTDFGIARVAEAAPLTATGTVLGTVHYMSPEQVAGDSVDPRSDIYSLGVVAFFALSGRFPFESPTASAVLVAHVTKRAPSLSSVAPHAPGELVDLIDRCLQKNPDSRYQSCDALLEDLERLESALPPDEAVIAFPVGGAISSTEAQEVWRRAAELQDMTGKLPALKVATEDEAARRRAAPVTTGFKVDQVRAAAEEAGIAGKFVERALVERGHLAGPDESAVVVREGVLPKYNRWLGGRSTIAYEAVVPGEMPERDFDLLVDIIRRALNDAGIVSAVGRSLTWTSADKQRRVQATVLVRDGRTTIHTSERLRDLAGGLFGGIVGGGGGGSIGPVLGITGEALSMPWLVPPMLLATVGTAYAIARTIFRRIHNSRSEVLRLLTERLAEAARDTIARRTVGAGYRAARKMIR